ncbi:MAG: thiamine phosphate synthase [Deltaproteobacteria bacterium]|nr:thiamine phosphate synthase [Deltaproteobacteria bacterium]
MSRRIDFSLYLITDRSILPPGSSLPEAVREALEGGVKCVQLREKDLSPGSLFSLALELRDLTRRYGAKLLINDRADVALACDADGVHLTSASLPVSAVRGMLGPEPLIGVSAHRLDEILKAGQEGADFATFGPVYFTPSKAAYGPPVGLEKLREVCLRAPLPVFALGGVKLGRLGELMAAGAAGVALISAILSFPDPRGQAQSFLQHLSRPRLGD